MSVLSGSTCNCNSIKSYLALTHLKIANIPSPNPAGSYLNLAQPVVTLPQPLTHTLDAWLLIP